MVRDFFSQPILNSPYECPESHWELDEEGQPTNRISEHRRTAKFITPVPAPRRRRGRATQREMVLYGDEGLSSDEQQYDPMPIITSLRQRVDEWRLIPDPGDWQVTPETARLLRHWRTHQFDSFRPFFCQVEAMETLIWLTEVAPKRRRDARHILDHLAGANEQANPGLARLALKLATGAGKTTVMAMLIAWQTVNAVRRPNSRNFTRGFLVVTPGITIRDRLRVLHPNDPASYYKGRELIPPDMLPDLAKARIVITNFHTFKRRETLDISRGGRSLLQGRTGPEVRTLETEGQMLQRVMPELMHRELADMACERITAAITRSHQGENPVKAILDPYNPAGSTRHVTFTTSRPLRWRTDFRRCHVNWAVCDSDWEAEFCRVVEKHPRVRAYVKNQGLGLEVPYRMGGVSHRYLPDFILLVDDQGQSDPLRLVVEIKGYRGEDAKVKKSTMETYWVPGVNRLGSFGRWAFAEFTNVYAMQSDFEAELATHFDRMIESVASAAEAVAE